MNLLRFLFRTPAGTVDHRRTTGRKNRYACALKTAIVKIQNGGQRNAFLHVTGDQFTTAHMSSRCVYSGRTLSSIPLQSGHPRPQGYPVFLNVTSNGLEALGTRMHDIRLSLLPGPTIFPLTKWIGGSGDEDAVRQTSSDDNRIPFT